MGPLGKMGAAGDWGAPAALNSRSADLRQLAADSRLRADRAATLRAMYAARAENGPKRLRAIYARAAELHRRIEVRQEASARLHEAYAARLNKREGGLPDAPQVLMEAVAVMLGIPGAAAALSTGGSGAPFLMAASDETARAACELEATTGEGPATMIVAAGIPVRATGAELPGRWPAYGRAAARLGIGAVTAVPLQLPTVRLGALCCYQAGAAAAEDILPAAETLAAALTPILLRGTPASGLPS